MSDVVRIGDATLYHGDCMEILPTLGKFDAVITDPPYGIRANQNPVKGVWGKDVVVGGEWDANRPKNKLWPVLLAAGVVHCIWGGNYFADQLPPSMKWLVWDKGTRDFSLADCELAWTSINKASRVLTYSRNPDFDKTHPTQKPLRVMTWTIEQAGPSATVLDPFMGSGTTGVACAQLGRKFTGIEIERKYFDIACERIERAYAQGQLIPHEAALKPEQQSMGL